MRAAAVAMALVVGLAGVARADDDEAAKKEAQALVTEGVAALKKKDYETARGKFEAAYAKFPSPKILLNLGTTLKDMGRLADAANTYQRYLGDPTVGADRLAEVRKILDGLDAQLMLLTIEVTPAGASVSIDGGESQVIGTSVVIRVDPGSHVVRATRAGLEPAEETVEGKAGAKRSVNLALKVIETEIEKDPENGTGTGTGTGPDVAVGGGVGDDDLMPPFVDADAEPDEKMTLPALAVQTRIDGKLRGAALAVAIDYAPIKMLEVEIAAMFSNAYGVYAGARYVVLPTRVSLHVGGGFPIFFSNGTRYGVRGAIGGEMQVQKHLALLAEVGFEHFFNPENLYEANVLVPILGIQGSLR